MPKVGDRYIIEIAEKYRVELTDGTSKIEDLPPRDLYRVRGIPDTFFLDDNFDKLDKYDSNNDNSYQRGLDDAWEAAEKVLTLESEELKEIFDVIYEEEVFGNFTPAKAIEKLRAYEEQRNAKAGLEALRKYQQEVSGCVQLRKAQGEV